MAITLRLLRLGKKNTPAYRIVAIDKRKKRNGTYVDVVGFYNPLSNPPALDLDQKKVEGWMNKGALVSEGLRKLLKYRRNFKRD
jgi:small subunit ribosomal protein S16